MGRKNKRGKYKYAVKRPRIKPKDFGRGFKKHLTGGGLKKKDIRKLKKKYGGIPRMPGLEPQFRNDRMSRDVYERRKNRYYEKLDGGTVDTMYISGPGPSRGKKRKRKDRDRDRRSRDDYSPSYDGYDDFKIDTSAYDKQIESLNDQINSLTAGFQQQAAAMQQQMEADRAAAAERMAEMQGNFRQQMTAAAGRPQVEGIRFADYGTGGATRRELARRGVSGTFGRTGDRLMQINSLNV